MYHNENLYQADKFMPEKFMLFIKVGGGIDFLKFGDKQ